LHNIVRSIFGTLGKNTFGDLQMATMVFLILLLLLVCAISLVSIALDVRNLVKSVDSFELTRASRSHFPVSSVLMNSTTHHISSEEKGFSVIWQWKNGQWDPMNELLPPLVLPGPPPSQPGKYPSDIVKTWVSIA
jgi:hypothetical protein